MSIERQLENGRLKKRKECIFLNWDSVNWELSLAKITIATKKQ